MATVQIAAAAAIAGMIKVLRIVSSLFFVQSPEWSRYQESPF
jgi:hypothetical protein